MFLHNNLESGLEYMLQFHGGYFPLIQNEFYSIPYFSCSHGKRLSDLNWHGFVCKEEINKNPLQIYSLAPTAPLIVSRAGFNKY